MLHFAVHKEQALHSRPSFSIFKNAPLEISAYTAPIGQKYLQKNLFTNTDPVKITKSKIPPTEHKGSLPANVQAQYTGQIFPTDLAFSRSKHHSI